MASATNTRQMATESKSRHRTKTSKRLSGLFKSLHRLPTKFVKDCGFIPVVLINTAAVVEKYIKTKEIFQTQGTPSKAFATLNLLSTGRAGRSGRHLTVHDAVEAMKLVLVSLPESLIPEDVCDALITASRENSAHQYGKILGKFRMKSPLNFGILHFMMILLRKVSLHTQHNLMDVRKLATIFVLDVIKPLKLDDPNDGEFLSERMQRLPYLIMVVEKLILNVDIFQSARSKKAEGVSLSAMADNSRVRLTTPTPGAGSGDFSGLGGIGDDRKGDWDDSTTPQRSLRAPSLSSRARSEKLAGVAYAISARGASSRIAAASCSQDSPRSAGRLCPDSSSQVGLADAAATTSTEGRYHDDAACHLLTDDCYPSVTRPAMFEDATCLAESPLTAPQSSSLLPASRAVPWSSTPSTPATLCCASSDSCQPMGHEVVSQSSIKTSIPCGGSPATPTSPRVTAATAVKSPDSGTTPRVEGVDKCKFKELSFKDVIKKPNPPFRKGRPRADSLPPTVRARPVPNPQRKGRAMSCTRNVERRGASPKKKKVLPVRGKVGSFRNIDPAVKPPGDKRRSGGGGRPGSARVGSGSVGKRKRKVGAAKGKKAGESAGTGTPGIAGSDRKGFRADEVMSPWPDEGGTSDDTSLMTRTIRNPRVLAVSPGGPHSSPEPWQQRRNRRRGNSRSKTQRSPAISPKHSPHLPLFLTPPLPPNAHRESHFRVIDPSSSPVRSIPASSFRDSILPSARSDSPVSAGNYSLFESPGGSLVAVNFTVDTSASLKTPSSRNSERGRRSRNKKKKKKIRKNSNDENPVVSQVTPEIDINADASATEKSLSPRLQSRSKAGDSDTETVKNVVIANSTVTKSGVPDWLSTGESGITKSTSEASTAFASSDVSNTTHRQLGPASEQGGYSNHHHHHHQQQQQQQQQQQLQHLQQHQGEGGHMPQQQGRDTGRPSQVFKSRDRQHTPSSAICSADGSADGSAELSEDASMECSSQASKISQCGPRPIQFIAPHQLFQPGRSMEDIRRTHPLRPLQQQHLRRVKRPQLHHQILQQRQQKQQQRRGRPSSIRQRCIRGLLLFTLIIFLSFTALGLYLEFS